MIKLEEIQEVLKQQKVAVDVIVKIIDKLREVEEDKKADKEVGPKAKNQLVSVIFDKDKVLKGDFTAAIFQIEEGAAPAAVIDRVKAAAQQYNASKKGRKSSVSSFAQALDMPRKFLKAEQVLVKTKQPILVVVSDNTL